LRHSTIQLILIVCIEQKSASPLPVPIDRRCEITNSEWYHTWTCSFETMPKVKTARQFTCNRCANPVWPDRREPRKVTFPTSDELDKHLQAEHDSAMYSCTAVGCFKGTSAPKFQKPETLTQHIKESHNPDTIFSCPVKTCTFEPSGLDDVAIHVHWVHTTNPSEPFQPRRFERSDRYCKEPRGFINAATWKYFRCPIWNCRKFVSGGHEKVSAHLLAHLPIELDNVRDELAFDGYEIHNAHSLVALSTGTLRASSVQIKCPACEVRCESDVKFRHHIETNHMLAKSPGMREHFETWRADVLSWSLPEKIKHTSRRPCWLNRHTRLDGHGSADNLVSYSYDSRQCSYAACSFVLESKEKRSHPSFLRSAKEIATGLWTHRAEILRHYPQFITCPMFQEQQPELEIL
jgi:hypothetical protein